jgi:hypothetical protein
MNDRMLNAVSTAVQMYRGAYTMAEALSYATVTHELDEFEQDDLPVIVRNQIARLKLQLGENF